ncbi:MAG TPA: hypothetical protein VFH51_09750 [Myxococcota bacterium]|nr:hypothetical protein [Myxococcota bacterium]
MLRDAHVPSALPVMRRRPLILHWRAEDLRFVDLERAGPGAVTLRLPCCIDAGGILALRDYVLGRTAGCDVSVLFRWVDLEAHEVAPGAFREALAARAYRLRRVRTTYGSDLVMVPDGRAVVLHDATLLVLPHAIKMLGVRLASVGPTLARAG